MFVRNGQKLGSLLVDKTSAGTEPEPKVIHRLKGQENESPPHEQPPVEQPPEQRSDGVHAVGGGWHEVVIDGEVIDKVRGAEAAQSAYDAYLQSDPGETSGTEAKEDDGDDDTVPA